MGKRGKQKGEHGTLARMGTFRWDATTNRVTWSDELYRIYARTPAQFAGTYEAFLSYVHPDDRPAVEAAVQRAVQQREPFRVRERILRPDGEVRTLDSAGELLLDPAGQVTALVGVCRDITEEERANAAVRESEARLRALIESMDDVAFEFDAEGTYLNIWTNNDSMLPRPRAEMLGRRVGFLFGDDWARPFIEAFRRVLDTGRPESIEYSWSGPAGLRWFSGRVSRIRAEEGAPDRISVLVREITDRKRAEDALHELSGRLLQVQDQERRLIARELHDTTSPLLAALINKLYTARQQTQAPDRDPLVSDAVTLAEKAAGIIRSVSYVLHPPLLQPAGLLAGLRWHLDRLATQLGIAVELDAPGELPRLPEDSELAVFRVTQEFLTNVPRRSGSRRVAVRVVPEGEYLALTLTDEGRALPARVLEGLQTEGDELGVGIAGMRERIRRLGGRLDLASGPTGTRARVTLPLGTR